MQVEADVLIVGSGPAGAAAALHLASPTTLMVDTGFEPSIELPVTNLFQERLGPDLEGLSIITEPYLSPKLRSPLFRFVTRAWRTLSPIKSSTFSGELSHAVGGLANAWGSGLYEFDDVELEKFPFDYAELEPYYLALTEHIGISGGGDDVAASLGSATSLLPPLPLAGPPSALYERVQQQGPHGFLRQEGIRIGRQRLGILSKPHRGRPAYSFEENDFFRPMQGAIYNPAFTVRELERGGCLRYQKELLVESFSETPDYVSVEGIDLTRNERVTFKAKRLLLAAGAINSARIVLRSFQDYSTKLPFLENPVSFIPFVHPGSIGRTHGKSFTGAQLALLVSGPEHPDRVQGSIYGLSGVMASDFLYDFPFSAAGNMFCLSQIVPAMTVLQLYYSDSPNAASFVRLLPDNVLEVRSPARRFGKVERKLIRALRRLGFLSAPSLVRYAEGGSSFHYAGTLPMVDRSDIRPLTTSPFGQLHGCNRVYVADAASFPFLPAKNLSLTIMANSMRIASHL